MASRSVKYGDRSSRKATSASQHRATERSRQIGGQRVARLRVVPKAGSRRAGVAGEPQGGAQSLVVPQEIARAGKVALPEQRLVLLGRAVLQPAHGRGQRLRSG